MAPCLDVYKAKIQYEGSHENLKLKFVVRVDVHNEEMIGDTWSTTARSRTMKYFLEGATNHKTRVHQLYFIT